METKRKNIECILKFDKSFRYPHYWGVQLGVAAIAGIALTPASFRDPTLVKLGRMVGRLGKSSCRRALVNLSLCFPKRSEAEREATVDEVFATVPQAMAMTVESTLRGQEKIQNRVDWQGLEIIEEMYRNDEKVIFLVPHGWGVDTPTMLMASQGQKAVAMFYNQGNPVFNYVWNTVCHRFGGRLHARNNGIKPFIQFIRQGYWGYYLSDQDHGPGHSEPIDLFATYRAMSPAIGRLMKARHARVVPLFPVYDDKTHRLMIKVRPPTDDILTTDDHIIARRMNEEVEIFVTFHVEQYTWILRLLKMRKPGEIEPYKRKGLYPKR